MRKKIDFKIDAVIPWVDDQDVEWVQKRRQYQQQDTDDPWEDVKRYRDWGTLRYLLRSIERNAPWINKVFLLTDNQRPSWLNREEIIVVDHSRFIPEEYLPTFNSNVIEMNVHHIQELSEHFILLNDDFLFTHPTSPEDFFTSDGNVVDVMAQSILMPRDNMANIAVNNISLINQVVSKRKWLKKYWTRALSPRNGILLAIMSLALSPLPYFTRFYDPHVGAPYLKKNFWFVEKNFKRRYETLLQNRFRDQTDISHWLVRYYQIVTGQAYPHSNVFGRFLTINNPELVQKYLSGHRRTKMIVLNGGVESDEDVRRATITMQNLQEIFPNKSKFER